MKRDPLTLIFIYTVGVVLAGLACIASLSWLCIRNGWWFGEYLSDPDGFLRKYTHK